MSDNITKRVGLGTAYGFAKAGGYEGTVAEFTELLGNIAIDLARIENLSVTVTTLPAGSQATASLNGSVLSLGIPKGDKGDKGNTGDTGSPAGFGTVSATVDANIGTPSVEVTASGADTAKNFAFAFHNLKGQKGDKGDTGEVSEAELAEALENFSENGTVANAEQLTTKIRANDQTPYLFRTSGGSVDIGDREYINGIVGGTVAWNQLNNAPARTYTENGITFTFASDGKVSISGTATADASFWAYNDIIRPIVGHKVAIILKDMPNGVSMRGGSTASVVLVASGTGVYGFAVASGTTVNYETYVNIHDLTLMFGSTIADYIYSLEQATAGAGVAFFKSLFPKPYYEYNSGELKSVKGLVSHDMVGFNVWDEEWVNGRWNSSNATIVDAPNQICSKNPIKVLPNTTYYMSCGKYPNLGTAFADVFLWDRNMKFLGYYPDGGYLGRATKEIHTTKDTAYITFDIYVVYGATYNHDICINLSWDGSEDGNYEPYQKWSYPLDSDLELRGIPKLDASNNLYYDGDVYESDGTVTRKYGVVDLGTLSWGKYQDRMYARISDMDATRAGIVCARYQVSGSGTFSVEDGCITSQISDNFVIVYDTAYTDADAFKTAMSGVYLVYELATPTTETADPYTSPQIVNDFGTEEFVIDDTIDVPIPVGNNTDYPIDLKAKVEMAPNSPDGDGDYIVRQTNGTNEYVTLANNATIQNILSRLEALEG